MAGIGEELKEKYGRDGAVGFLDVTDDLERILPGGSEEERNESRLNKVITGEKRPLSHSLNEVGAWAGSNIGLPLLAAFLKGAHFASKATKGVEQVNKIAKAEKIPFTAAAKKAEKLLGKAVKESEEKLADKVAEAPKNLFLRMMWNAGGNTTEERFAKRIAKDAQKNVKKAIKAVANNPPGPVKEVIKQEAINEAGKAALASAIGKHTADAIETATNTEKGSFEKMDGLPDFDNDIEFGAGRRGWQFIKGLFDLNDLDPGLYPMDKVTDLLMEVNDRTGKWRGEQIVQLGDDEKIKLLKNIADGKYDKDGSNLSYELFKAYKNINANNKDEK